MHTTVALLLTALALSANAQPADRFAYDATAPLNVRQLASSYDVVNDTEESRAALLRTILFLRSHMPIRR